MSGILVIIFIILTPAWIILLAILVTNPVIPIITISGVALLMTRDYIKSSSERKTYKRSIKDYFDSCDELSSKKYPRKEDLEFLSTLHEKDLDGRIFLKEIGFDLHDEPKDAAYIYEPLELRKHANRHQIAKRLAQQLGIRNLGRKDKL